MEVGTKVTITPKKGKKFDAEFVSAKSGWITVAVKGEGDSTVESKHRAACVVLFGEKPAKKDSKKARKPVVAKKAAASGPIEGDDNRLIKAALENYTLHASKTKAGRRHLDIDDSVAGKLREMSLDQIYTYAAKICEVSQVKLREQYNHLNLGMQRMNLGNRIRAVHRLGEKVQSGFSKLKKGETAPA